MRLLFFFPQNPLDQSQGNNKRALELLKYFKSRKFYVDFVGVESKVFQDNEITELQDTGLITKGFLLPDTKNSGFEYLLKISIPRLFSSYPKAFDRRKINQQSKFDTILKEEEYDYIIISYSCWLPLIIDNSNKKRAKIIVDTHDFLTSQFQNQRKFDLGSYFKAEMKLLDSVDRIWAISSDEKYIYEQFLSTNVDLVPHTLQEERWESIVKDIDLIYVASDNEHNKIGAKWFFEEVYPKLSKEIKITIVGKIVDFIPDVKSISKLNNVENLSELYQKSKISICPMMSGTGLKIKVVEALSHGIPVVCNERGVDGLLNKTNNGCMVTNSATEFSLYIEKLLNDTDYYTEQSLKATRFYKETLSEDHVYQKLDSIFCL